MDIFVYVEHEGFVIIFHNTAWFQIAQFGAVNGL